MLSVNTFAEPIKYQKIEALHSKNIHVYDLKKHTVYAISCTSDLQDLIRHDNEDMDKLSLHINPGKVTDRHGRHGVTPNYDFPAPIGTAYFYAEPNGAGNIDFAIVNTTMQSFYVACNINLQDFKE